MSIESYRKRVVYLYDDKIGNFYYGAGHPMKPHRICLTHSLLVNYGLYSKMEIYKPRKATSNEMVNFHSREYIKFIRSIRPNNTDHYNKQIQRFCVGADCPVFYGLYEFCQLSSGGTLRAADKLNTKSADICINWGGGLHHAKKDQASGFCYVNDIVLGILELLKYHQRVLYIDIDVHHGDGVEEAFFSTDRVMTVSFHKYGTNYFPGTGDHRSIGIDKGKYYSVNVPMRDGMDDDSYESMFKPIMVRVMEVFQPNAVVLQCGADSLAGDKLGCFNLTIKGHGKCVEFIKRYNLPLLMLGGGGYTIKNVSRCWTYETALAVGTELSDDLPYNEYFNYFGPDYKLHISPLKITNKNSREFLEKIKIRLFENLRMLPHVPGVQVQAIPEDGMCIESDDEDNINPDERNPESIVEKRIALDNEFSDSEDEGMAPGVRSGVRKDNRSYKTYPPARKQARLDSNGTDISKDATVR